MSDALAEANQERVISSILSVLSGHVIEAIKPSKVSNGLWFNPVTRGFSCDMNGHSGKLILEIDLPPGECPVHVTNDIAWQYLKDPSLHEYGILVHTSGDYDPSSSLRYHSTSKGRACPLKGIQGTLF